MRILLALLLALTLAAPAEAAKTRKKRKLPKLLLQVEDKYEDAETLVAEFSQVEEQAAMHKTKKSSGIIMAKIPGKIRWESKVPDNSLLVSDGKTFWFYTPPFDPTEHGQVLEKKASQVQSRVTNALLQGSFSVVKNMKIKKLGPSSFLLTPKKGSAGTVEKAEVEVDPKELLIRKVTLMHKGGNRAEISLNKIVLGKDLKDDLFVFKAPPGTEKLDP